MRPFALSSCSDFTPSSPSLPQQPSATSDNFSAFSDHSNALARMRTFEDLPNEIVLQILELIPRTFFGHGHPAAAGVLRVNHRLHDLVKPLIWRSIHVGRASNRMLPVAYHIFSNDKAACAVRTLHTIGRQARSTPTVPDQTLEMWREASQVYDKRRWENARMGWPAESDLDALIRHKLEAACGPDLAQRYFADIRSGADHLGTFFLIALSCPNLTYLALEGTIHGHPLVQDVLRRRSFPWPSLGLFMMGGCGSRDSDTESSQAQKDSMGGLHLILTTLSMTSINLFGTIEGLQPIPPATIPLPELTLGCDGTRSQAVESMLIRACSGIKTLTFNVDQFR